MDLSAGVHLATLHKSNSSSQSDHMGQLRLAHDPNFLITSVQHQCALQEGATPLHVAARTGNLAAMEKLLAAGASKAATDKVEG